MMRYLQFSPLWQEASYIDFLQTRNADQPVIDPSCDGLTDQTRKLLVGLSAKLEPIDQALAAGFAGTNELVVKITDSLGELKRLAKSPAHVTAFELFELASTASKRGLPGEALAALERAIASYPLEWSFHLLRGILLLGSFSNHDNEILDFPQAERSLSLAARYAEASLPDAEAAAKTESDAKPVISDDVRVRPSWKLGSGDLGPLILFNYILQPSPLGDAARATRAAVPRALAAAGWAAYLQSGNTPHKREDALRLTLQAVVHADKIIEIRYLAAKLLAEEGKVLESMAHLRAAISSSAETAIFALGDPSFQRVRSAIGNVVETLAEEKKSRIQLAMRAFASRFAAVGDSGDAEMQRAFRQMLDPASLSQLNLVDLGKREESFGSRGSRGAENLLDAHFTTVDFEFHHRAVSVAIDGTQVPPQSLVCLVNNQLLSLDRVFVPHSMRVYVSPGRHTVTLTPPGSTSVVADIDGGAGAYLRFDVKSSSNSYHVGVEHNPKLPQAKATWHQAPAVSASACFMPNAQVLTPGGPMPIASVLVGATVVGRAANGATIAAKVVASVRHDRALFSRVSLEDGTALDTTKEHRVLTPLGFRQVSTLRVGDTLIRGDASHLRVTALEHDRAISPAYNLVVWPSFTYIADGIVVHSFTFAPRLREFLTAVAVTCGQAFRPTRPIVDRIAFLVFGPTQPPPNMDT